MDQIGTSGNDTFELQASLQHLTVTLSNPYSGQMIDLDEEKNVNFSKYYGYAGFDRINLSSNGDAIFLEDRDTGEQMVFDVEFIQGRAGGDVINFASATIDYSQGIVLNGGSEDDILWGNIGNDSINGVDGDDNIDGGPGEDILDGFRGSDTIYGGDGDDMIYADARVEIASISGDDLVYGGNGNDLIWGGYGMDVLHGDAGNDEIEGESGDDYITGGSGNDIINGGNGSDILIGGTGGDDSNFVLVTQVEYEFNETLLFPTLVERKNIGDLSPPGTANLGVVEGNLSTETQTSAKITFLQSGAGYHNTLGFYNVAEDGTIQMAQIAFDSVHRSVAQPGLEYTVNLPGAPDSHFGFFIIADGFRKNASYNNLDLDNPDHISFIYKFGTADERAANISDNGSDVDLVYNDGVTILALKGNIYHTHERGGAGVNLNADGAEHVVSGIVEEGDTSTLRIGFEDLKNLGDADFNDVVFDLEIMPTTSVETVTEDNDIINGGAGEDLIWGGYGDDILTGGADSDTFLFYEIDYSLDTITDFEVGVGGDVINLNDMIALYNPLDHAISDFLHLENDILSIDVDGGGDHFVEIAFIENGLGGASLQDLLDNGNLVIDQPIVL